MKTESKNPTREQGSHLRHLCHEYEWEKVQGRAQGGFGIPLETEDLRRKRLVSCLSGKLYYAEKRS